MSNRASHWKRAAPGLVRQYLFQDAAGDEVIIRQVTGPNGSNLSVHLPKCCMDCGNHHPREGFAPAFNQNELPGKESLILLCNSCYDRRCAREHRAEREALQASREAEARRLWLEKNNRQRTKNREYAKRFREKQRKAG